MKNDTKNTAGGGCSSHDLLAIRMEGTRTRLEVAFWANFVVLMCFQSDNEIFEWVIMGVSAACMIAFYLIDRKYQRLTEELDDMANDEMTSTHH
jgi:hypothetical protein